MKRYLIAALAVAGLGLLPPAYAGDDGEVFLGGALGAGLGAWIGNEVEGRDGALIGGVLGAGLGAVIANDDDRHRHRHYAPPRTVRHVHHYDRPRHAVRHHYHHRDRGHHRGWYKAHKRGHRGHGRWDD